MKKIIFTILAVAVFFIGLSGLVEKTGASFKSDERASEVIAQARQAIGGETAIKNVQSITILGNAAQTFTIEGAPRTEQGKLEINLQMPNQFSRMLKIGDETVGTDNAEAERVTRVIKITKDDKAISSGDHTKYRRKISEMKKGGEEEEVLLKEDELPNGNRVVAHRDFTGDASRYHQSELFRTTFALLLSAPAEGSDATYRYVGAEAVDGKNCDVISVERASSASAFKLFIDQSSHLPTMLSYQDPIPLVFKLSSDEMQNGSKIAKNFLIGKDGSQAAFDEKVMQMLIRNKAEAMGEYQIRFSDFRVVNDVQLPYNWTQTVNGQPSQDVKVQSYEINPANIADKFKTDRIIVATRKAQ